MTELSKGSKTFLIHKLTYFEISGYLSWSPLVVMAGDPLKLNLISLYLLLLE